MWGRIDQTGVVRGNQVTTALAAVVAFLVVEVATRTATSMAYVGGAFVAAAVLIGPAAPLAGATGVVVHDVVYGAFGDWTVATAAWILVFGWAVVWLGSGRSNGPDGQALKSVHRVAPACAGIVVIGGINATAFAAWLAMVLGSQRFYTAATGFLPGIVAAVGLCVFGLVAVGVARRLGLIGRTDTRGRSLFEPEAPGRNRSEGPTRATTVGVFVIGTGWLFGVSVLDVFVHDLTLYPTANEFRGFLTGFLGGDSPIATVLLGVYNYGELAVVLSAPVALLALLGWCAYHEQVLSGTDLGVDIIFGGPSNE